VGSVCSIESVAFFQEVSSDFDVEFGSGMEQSGRHHAILVLARAIITE